MPLDAPKKRAEELVSSVAEHAGREIKAAEETIWHALETMGSLLTPGSHRHRGRSRRR
ncbi:MAG TPA: hypothetical protein VE990_00565 [Acidimicrobiales bacterium]|nr:hypothetical protein [Acidimicrobiales bacterium]